MSTTYPDLYGSLQDGEANRGNLQYMLMRSAFRFRRLQGYYEGQHGHHFSSVGYNTQFGVQMRGYRDNFLPMILQEYAARLNLKGFRVGELTEDNVSDQRSQEIWNSNFMGAEWAKAELDAMKFGISYVLVDPFLKSPDGLAPRITVESPIHMYALPDPTNRYQFVSAIKQWQGVDGFMYENVYYPDHVDQYKTTAHASIEYTQPGTGSWQMIGQVENPLKQVPIVALENASQTHVWGGVSDLEVLIPLQDQINTLQKNMMVASEYQAFRQRLILGVDVARDPKTDRVIDPDIVFASSRVIMIPSKDAKVAEWEQMDPGVYTGPIEETVHHLSALSKMPAYLLANKIANLSADAMRAAEQGFVDSLGLKQRWYSPGASGTMRLALLADDNDGAKEQIMPIWAPAAAASGSVLSNELTQMAAIGVNEEILWERWGMTPEEIVRNKALNKANPKPPPTTTGGPASGTSNFGTVEAADQQQEQTAARQESGVGGMSD
jgi:hypothetical protein